MPKKIMRYAEKKYAFQGVMQAIKNELLDLGFNIFKKD